VSAFKSKVFPSNPFLLVFSRIAMIDAAVMAVSVALSVWQTQWMWYVMGAGVLMSGLVFVVLNQRVIRSLACPHCHQAIAFEKGEGLVCEKCKTIWELG